MKRRWIFWVSAGLLLPACGDKAGSDEGATAPAGDSSSGGGGGEEQIPSTTSGDSGAASESTGDGATTAAVADSSGSGGGGFITPPDGAGVNVECDIWAQDCMAGEKCMPWANDGGSAWNATKCVPINETPAQVGDECMVDGSGVSGIDNCDISSMCYYVDAETNVGTCISFCEGSEANPVCQPEYVCSIVNDGVLILCRPECDPLLQDCEPAGSVCLPAAGSERFTCIIDSSLEMGAAGDACEFINACDGGLFCADAAGVPNCQGATGCCTEFCDLSAPDPNMGCSLGNGVECVAWYADGEAPPGLESVGACVLPA